MSKLRSPGNFPDGETPPVQIGRYRILQEIGSGGFSTVYLAEDTELEDQVAVKILEFSHARDSDLVQRFLAEGRLLRRVKCSGLLSIYDLGVENDRPYIVTEFCAGGSLRDRLQNIGRPLYLVEAFGLARSIGRAMSEIHGTHPPLVHRDIKPANLLIRRLPHQSGEPIGDILQSNEEIVVADFGIAKALTSDNSEQSRLIYTTGYAAPELAKGQTGIGQSVDVYSTSAVVLSALTGNEPRPVWTAEETAFDSSAYQNCGDLAHLLKRGLSYQPENRPANMASWLEELEASSSADGLHTTINHGSNVGQDPSASYSESPHNAASSRGPIKIWSSLTSLRRRYWLALAGGFLLLTLLGLFYILPLGNKNLIVGPSTGFVGQEAAFFISGTDSVVWEIDGETSTDPVLRLSPTSTGQVSIKVITAEGNHSHTYEVQKPNSSLKIEGPSYAVVGEIIQFSSVEGSPALASWRINNQTIKSTELQLRAIKPGLLEIELLNEEGETVSRTVTIGSDE